MFFDHGAENRLDALKTRLEAASLPSGDLFTDIMRTCTRLPGGASAKAALARLLAAGAWTELALAIVAAELPAWQIRRLALDEGEWICTLSRQTNLPDELDETVDAHHESLPLAILLGLVNAEAFRGALSARPLTVPLARPMRGAAVICENFS